jgi:xanthine/uracil permease
MPQSKSRHPHKHTAHHETHAAHPKHKKTNQSMVIGVLFFALIGLGISYFTGASSITGLLIGVLIGGVVGYFFAWQVNKSLTKK